MASTDASTAGSATAGVVDRLAHPTDADVAAVDAWRRANNYLTVGQIYLMANPLLREPLASRTGARTPTSCWHAPGTDWAEQGRRHMPCPPHRTVPLSVPAGARRGSCLG